MSIQTNMDKLLPDIATARLASNEAIAKHDTAGIAAHWLDDIVITTGNGLVLTGKEAVINVFKSLFEKSPGLVYVRTPQHIFISDTNTLAFETGLWKGSQVEGEHPEVSGSYAAMWKIQNGEWKIRSELFVTLQHG